MVFGGLDVGTTGCKIVLYNENAELLNTFYREYNVVRKNGQHEIDFYDIKDGVLGLLKKAVNQYKIDALGVTSFGETFAMLDENDNILAPSMLYTDHASTVITIRAGENVAPNNRIILEVRNPDHPVPILISITILA